MVFGNTFNVTELTASLPQEPIYAMRTSRAIRLDEITSRTQLSADEVRRFNPALTDRVPANATLYLPFHVGDFGVDVAFWRRPASPLYLTVLNEFLRLSGGPERWDDPGFEPVLWTFQRRFDETDTEEGDVMATVLEYAIDQAYRSPRRALLLEFRESERVRWLFERGVAELDRVRRRSERDAAARRALPAAESPDMTFFEPLGDAFRRRNIATP
jgi:hypothetical protein